MGCRAPRLAGAPSAAAFTASTTASTASSASSVTATRPPTALTLPSPLVQNVNVFKFGSDSIGICEAGGRRIVERVFEAQQKAYAATAKIQSAARRRSSAAAAAADVAAAAAAAAAEGGGAGGDDGLHTHDAGMAATGPTTMV